MTNPGVAISASLAGFRATATHGPSQASLTTVPPQDNGGDGSSFSPTDLLATSLGLCAITTMALQAQRERLSWADGASVQLVKEMTGPPRRVGTLRVAITMPVGVKPEDRPRLEEIARGCPVARSLHPDVQVPMTFSYP